jgi:hypothetical protein
MFDVAWQWISAHQGITTALVVVSVVTFVGSLVALPYLAARIPADYFVDPKRHRSRLHRMHPALYLALRVAKNLFGWLLVLAGLLMLVLPGQGLLTILVGVLLSDFPGKFRVERWLACRQGVLRAINWLRRRSGSEPLLAPRRPDGSDCTA